VGIIFFIKAAMSKTNFDQCFKKCIILAAIFLLSPFFYLFIWIKNFFVIQKNIKSILVIDNAKIGDLVCATPVFRAIKEKYPEVQLAVLVTPRVEEILQNNKRINKIIVNSLNSKKKILDVWHLIKEIRKKILMLALI